MRTLLAVFLATTLTVSASSCCVFKHNCKPDDTLGQIGTLVVDCGLEGLKQVAMHLVPAIIAIVTGGAPNWGEQLEVLKNFGLEALACAMQQAGQEIQNASMTAPAPGLQTHYLVKMKVAPKDAMTRITSFLAQTKNPKDGRLVTVQFAPVKP